MDKETPIKAMSESRLSGRHIANCGKCKELIVNWYRYCPHCGQRIEWVDASEDDGK